MRSQNIINFILLASILVLAGLSLSLLGPFYPSHALTKGVSITQSGLVFASVFAAAVIATPICGQYVHLGGPKIFFIHGALVIGFGNIAFGLLDQTDNTYIFLGFSFAIRIFIAFGEGAILASAYTLAAQQASKKHEGKLIAIAEACFGIGTMFGPSVGGILFQLGGFPLPFILCGGLILVFMVASIFLIKDCHDQYELLEEDERLVGWSEILSTPGIPISMFALTFAGTAWSWYSGTLEPFLEQKFHVHSSEVGLIFMTFSVGYTFFTPIFGILMDKGLNGLTTLLIGNTIITISYIFMGPSPLFYSVLGRGNLLMTTVANGVNGMGCAATYLGSLVYMVKSAEAHLPNNDKTKGMVSSLWVVSYSAGGYFGSTFGGLTYDQLGFENGTLIIMSAMAFSVVVLVAYMAWYKCKAEDNKSLPLYIDPEESYQGITEVKTELISDLAPAPESPPRSRRFLG